MQFTDELSMVFPKSYYEFGTGLRQFSRILKNKRVLNKPGRTT